MDIRTSPKILALLQARRHRAADSKMAEGALKRPSAIPCSRLVF